MLLVLNVADNVSTHILLTNYSSVVEEANVIHAVLFPLLGMDFMLVAEWIFVALGLLFILNSFPSSKLVLGLMGAMDVGMTFVVVNNFKILHHLGYFS